MVDPKARCVAGPVWILLLTLGLGATAVAQSSSPTFNPVESHGAKTLLRRAAEQVAQEQWPEAIDLYQKVIAEFGDNMAELQKGDPLADPTGTVTLLVDARQHAQARLAALPPAALALYRARVDAQAERLFRQGLANRDRAALRRVLDGMFASSWGDDALELLGDLAFHDGQFGEALMLYRRIVPDRRSGAIGLAYPDPDVDLARVAAKALLARVALGTDPPTADDLREFAKAYPDAKGMLAGREGSLAQSVATAMTQDHLAPPQLNDGRWPTFAGAASRSHVAPEPIDVGQLRGLRKWDTPPAAKPNQNNNMGMGMRGGFGGMPMQPMAPAAGVANDLQLPFHPIILGDQVVVCDEVHIHAYHLDGRPNDEPATAAAAVPVLPLAWSQPPLESITIPQARNVGAGAPRFTLSASADRIFARLGGMGRGSASRLVAVRNNRDIEGKLLWELPSNRVALPRARPDAPNRFTASFEGTPVADERNVYVALSEGLTDTSTYVAAIDAETGAVRWVRFLGNVGGVADNVGGPFGMNGGMNLSIGIDTGNRLLTLDGQTIYYQTNLGALLALDAETGAIRWLVTYNPRGRGLKAPARESNPAVVHDGLVMIAPDDSQPIYAFDGATGRLVWKTPPMERVSHLLGVAKGRLIATGDRVYSFDLKDGSLKAAWPDGTSGHEPCGRGLLAGDSIYWPTKTDIYVLDQATGMPGDREPIRLMQHFNMGGGNLAAGDGYLVVAQKDAVVVFAQSSRVIEGLKLEIAKNPAAASPYYQLARVAETTGRDELALENLEEARKRAKPNDSVDGRPLADEARARQYKLLIRLAAKARDANHWAARVGHLKAATLVARNERDALAARLALAEAQTKADDPKAAVVTLQEVLADESLRARSVPGDADERWTVRADLLVADLLESVLKAGGRDLYAEYDAKAEALFEQGRKEKSARVIEEVSRAYPAARVAPESLLVLGAIREEKDPSGAARAFKRIAGSPLASDAQRARALIGLARVYESQGLVVSSREALLRAQARFAEMRLDDLAGTVGSFVAETLARPPFNKSGSDRAEGALTLPLARIWDRPSPMRPILADGIPPSPVAGRIFLANRSSLRPVDPSTGDSAWTFEPGEEPSWIGYLADRLVVATPGRVASLDPATGEVRWRFPAEAGDAKAPAINPFANPPGAARPASAASSGKLHDFRVAGHRVFCIRGERELVALDGDTGIAEWSFRSADALNPNVLIGPRRVVVQVEGLTSQTLVVLDTDTGRRRGEFGLSAGDKSDGEAIKPWSRPPLAVDDDHAFVTLSPKAVALVDLNTGARVWTSRAGVLPRHNAPRLLGDSSRLLVLYEGNELVRLDPANGRGLWTRSLGTGEMSEQPEAFAIDGERIYCVTGANLAAYNLGDGAPLWTRPLTGPKSKWLVTLADRYVAAYPGPAGEGDGPIEGLPLVVCRRDDGALVQRLAFPATVGDLAVALQPKGAMVATRGGVWALGAPK